MKQIEKFISPLIQQQFPEFYRDEGKTFITFVKAYYEWLENNLQEIILENDANFNIGDLVEQGEKQGKIITKYGDRFLVEVYTDEQFKCNRICNDLTLITSSSGGSTYIVVQRRFNVEHLARRLPEFRNIDKTIEQFIISFKNKYLPDIQFTTASNKQLFIKNSLDFYRAKGTERAVDLFFKLIYGFEARVYTPGDDLFKPSDNEWVNVQYLEIEEAPDNIQFVGQIIYGAKTGATAFVERLVRIRKNSRYISILYLANVDGNFATDETVYTKDLIQNVTTRVLGSLTTLEVISSEANFIVGETVIVSDGAGKSARARVTSVIDKVGTIDFELLQGGWGYTEDALVLSSQRMFRLNSVIINNTDYMNLNDPFYQFETIKQDLISVQANTLFSTGTLITGYDGANTETFVGKVVARDESLSTMVINYNEETTNTTLLLTTTELYTSGNVLSTDILSINNNVSATANIIASGISSTITYTGTPAISNGDIIYQISDIGEIYANAIVIQAYSNPLLSETYIDIERDTGVFRTDRPFYRTSDSQSYNIQRIANSFVGVIDVVNTFYNNANTYGLISGSHSEILSLSYETEGEIDILSFNNTQEYENFYSEDLISATANLFIDEVSYGLSNDPLLGFEDIIANAAIFSNVSLSSIDSILVRNPGSGYPVNPYYIIFEPKTFHLERYDYTIKYVEGLKSFLRNEIVVGQTSGARGVIITHRSVEKTIIATRISTDSVGGTSADFEPGEIILGTTSNVSATIQTVYENRRKPRTGLNAIVKSDAQSGIGFVSSLQIIDSGFGYFDDELLTLVSLDKQQRKIAALVKLGKQGIGEGYHTSSKSFLSTNKYLQDSDFYQEYSYEVLTSLPFEVYKRTLIDVLHVAGTKPFGSYSGTIENSIEINSDSSIIQFDDI
jgi:hypothetical protein